MPKNWSAKSDHVPEWQAKDGCGFKLEMFLRKFCYLGQSFISIARLVLELWKILFRRRGEGLPPCTLERLTDFMSLISLYTPLKHQKTSGFIINKSVTRYALQINATGFYMLVSLVLLKAHSQVWENFWQLTAL